MDRKIVDYVIVSSYEKEILNSSSVKVKFDDDEEISIKSFEHYLEARVKNLLTKGFQLYGSLQLHSDLDGYAVIFQTMVKYEE